MGAQMYRRIRKALSREKIINKIADATGKKLNILFFIWNPVQE